MMVKERFTESVDDDGYDDGDDDGNGEGGNLHFHHCGAPRHPCLVGHLLLLFIAKWP